MTVAERVPHTDINGVQRPDRRLSVLQFPTQLRELTRREELLRVKRELSPDGNRMVSLDVGPMHVTAIEIPGERVSDAQWDTILYARESYANTLGKDLGTVLGKDNTDGREKDSPYKTFHYIGRVQRDGEEDRVIVKKKVYIKPDFARSSSFDPERHAPDDIRFWKPFHQLLYR